MGRRTVRREITIGLLVAVTLCGAFRHARADDLGKGMVIVYNVENPDSRVLADYYALKRGVPTSQICGIDIRDAETITREEFNRKIRDPISEFLVQHGLLEQEPRTIVDSMLGKIPGLGTVSAKVTGIVLMYGVPLRIDNDPNVVENVPTNAPPQYRRNDASVESELATLPSPGAPINGFLKNPFFGNESTHFGAPLNKTMLLVGRLDGPDPSTVRRIIDDSLAAERYGVNGRAYFDWRGMQDRGYVEGDNWIRGAYRACREAGYECDYDDRPETFDQDYPMTDVAIYAGWYAPNVCGPFVRPDFHFRTGALAYHLHSSSGASVRTRTAYWVGPFLAKGAAATIGNVFEPYLALTPHIDMFFQRLLDGATFLEAGYYSQPALSWQTTFVGDPLYRPFAASLDEQIQHLEADHRSDVEWAYLRKVNLLLNQGLSSEAEKLCQARADALHSAALFEKLGDLRHASHNEAGAIIAYGKADEKMDNPYRHVRVITKMATAFEFDHQNLRALAVYENLISSYPSNHNAVAFCTQARDLAREVGNDVKARFYQVKIDELTAPPPKETVPPEKK
ncbi:MAG TPA: TIGR03790 family protein [Verrucomicrobiae bacterium]|nr:TIGR03790 family protein [Verrucomicrobiae bacterium]